MANQLALKRLSVSELLMFEPYYRASGEGAKQKAINLNADVFARQLYPGVDTIARTRGNRIPVFG